MPLWLDYLSNDLDERFLPALMSTAIFALFIFVRFYFTDGRFSKTGLINLQLYIEPQTIWSEPIDCGKVLEKR